jgi:tRNA pseudouridine55 synthase
MFGILNINKPKGYTSHDVVAKLRKILKIKQIGHTGTLDPMATGVLPICIGKATKIIQYLDGDKSYRASIKLGIKTDTYDIEGKILEETDAKADITEIKLSLKTFEGEIEQTPPMYSAIHYQGKRLYEYARQNIEITDIPKRKVTIRSIELLGISEEDDKPVITVDIACSSVTYIRSIAHDMGEMLGCGATLCGLVRTKACQFDFLDSYAIEKIEEYEKNNRIKEILINPIEVLNLKIINVEETQLADIKNGKQLYFEDINLMQNQKIQLVCNTNLVAIAEFQDSRICPKTVFI